MENIEEDNKILIKIQESGVVESLKEKKKLTKLDILKKVKSWDRIKRRTK